MTKKKDTQLQPIVVDVRPYASITDMVEIPNENVARQVANALVEVKCVYDEFEAQRTSLTIPINVSKRNVDMMFADIKKLKAVYENCCALLAGWNDKQQLQLVAMRDREAKRVEKREPTRALDIRRSAYNEPVFKHPGVAFRRKAVANVLDVSKVPREFLTVDVARVTKALEAGIAVPGCELSISFAPHKHGGKKDG